MPKAVGVPTGFQINESGDVGIVYEWVVTDNAGKMLGMAIDRDGRRGKITQKSVLYATGTLTAAQVNDAIEQLGIQAGQNVNQVLAVTDVIFNAFTVGA